MQLEFAVGAVIGQLIAEVLGFGTIGGRVIVAGIVLYAFLKGK